MKNHYGTLGLQEGASQEEIQTAYERLSKELDPANNNNQEFFKEEYDKVQNAYQALLNSSILATGKGDEKHERKSLKAGIKNTEDSPPIPIKYKSFKQKKSKFMKTYSKIVGVIITTSLLVAFGLITFLIFDISDFEEKLITSLFYIPCIAFLHYMYIHNFGFSLNSMIPKSKYKVILILSIISIVTVLIMPTYYLIKQNRNIDILKETIDRGEYSRTDYVATLKTKYENREIYYLISIKTPNKSRLPSKYKTFSLNFFDKDGFKIQSFKLKDGITNWLNDKDQIYGLEVNSSESIYDFENYLKIADWNITYFTD